MAWANDATTRMDQGTLPLMPWVLFTANFDFHPPENRFSFVAYKAGMIQFVRRVCAERAIASGKAEPTVRPQ